MGKHSIIILILIFLISLTTVVSSQVRLEQIGIEPLNSKSVTIYDITPYDNGVVVTLGHTNYTPSSPHHISSTLCIYFFNSTTKLLLYRSTLTTISYAFTYVEDGDLYVAINSPAPPGSRLPIEVYLYVFRGLKLTSIYILRGLLLYEVDDPIFNLSVPLIDKFFNVTITLNSSNITLRELNPLIALQLPTGVFIVSYNVSYLGQFGQTSYAIPFNFTMYNYDGKIVWSKTYYITPSQPLYELLLDLGDIRTMPTEYLLLDEGFATVVGDQLFIINATQTQEGYQIVGIDLANGMVTAKIGVKSLAWKTALLNIGGRLYLAIFGKNTISVEKYNGMGFNTVFNGVFDSVFYDFTNYLVVVNVTHNRSDFTDIYPGGVIHYTLNGEVLDYYIAKGVMLLNESNSSSLAFLYNNGTLEEEVNIGNITPALFSFIRYPSVYLAEIKPYEYYIIKVYSNTSTFESELVVYKTIPQKNESTSAVSYISGKTTTIPYSLAFPIALVVAIVGLVLKRKRK